MGNLAQVFLATKHGVEAKNYENLGDAAKLKPLEVELKRLEDMSESIVQDFAFMRKREVRTRTRKPTYYILLYHYLNIFRRRCEIRTSLPTAASFTSRYSRCAAYWVWRPGRWVSTSCTTSRVSNSLSILVS